MRIAVYHQHLNGGGATHVALTVVRALMKAGYEVDLVVNRNEGSYNAHVPAGVRVFELRRASQQRARFAMIRAAFGKSDLLTRSVFVARKQLDMLLYLPSLARYMRRRRPAVMIANLWQLGLVAVSARELGYPKTRVACVFHSAQFHHFGVKHARSKRPGKWVNFFAYCRLVYEQADALVSVSKGIADDLQNVVGLPADTIRTINNPVVSTRCSRDQIEKPNHPWFQPRRHPILVAAGRLSPEKNYGDLIDAFAILKQRVDARLLILGEGVSRPELEESIKQRGLAESVDMPGWVSDPSAWLTHADGFVLCSKTEGLPTVLIDALACGCPCISYDCPHGPREVLADGRYGALVQTGDTAALAVAIEKTLSQEIDRDFLRQRARAFSIEAGVAAYLELVNKLTQRRHKAARTNNRAASPEMGKSLWR